MTTPKDKLKIAVEDGSAIPAGPMVMGRISEICRDPDATARDLAKVIQLDSTLAARVLKQVNSSFYGLSARVKTVTHAVVILGFQEVKHLALAVPVANFFQNNTSSPGIDIKALWDRTLIIACIARALSYHIEHPIPEQVFVSAILAKSGMIVMNSILAGDYKTVVDCAPELEKIPQTEKEMLGISHVQLGWMLAKKWNFPDELLDAIAYQYNPCAQGNLKTEPGLIFCARRLLDGIRADITIKDILLKIPVNITEEFKLTQTAAEAAIERASGEFEEVRRILETE